MFSRMARAMLFRILCHLLVLASLGGVAARAGAGPSELARLFAAASEAGDETAVVSIGRELVAAAPFVPDTRIRLAVALLRTGDVAGAVAQLDAAARIGGSASPEELAVFASRHFHGLRERLLANARPKVRSTTAFVLAERDLLPGSAALDPVDGAWYVGSLRKRKIVRLSAKGRVSDWIAPGRDHLGAVLGIKIDGARRELWAASCNDPGGSPAIVPPDPESLGRGALYRFALPGGELTSVYPAGGRDAPVCFNDLTLSADGTLYATGTGGIWRLLPGAESVELWRPDAGPLNGIAVSPDGSRLFVADRFEGVIRVDPVAGTSTLVRHSSIITLAGIDGLDLIDDSLVAIQNGFHSGPQRVIQAFLTADGTRTRCVSVLERNHPGYSVPTARAVVGGELVYSATSQLDRVGADGEIGDSTALVPNLFLRLPLYAECVPDVPTISRAQLDPCDVAPLDDEGGMAATRRRLYQTTCAAALWFDGLFGEHEQIAAARRTSGHIELAALGSEFDGLSLRVRVHVRMELPNLKHRTALFLGRDESDDVLRDRSEGLALRSQFANRFEDEDWVAGLGYSLPSTQRQRTEFRVGVRGSQAPEVFVQGRYRRNDALGSRSLLRTRETVFWTNRDGIGATTTLDIDRVFGENFLLRWGNAGTWTAETASVYWRSAFILYQNMNRHRAIAYQAFVRGATATEVPLREFGGRTVYRQPLFGREWLFGEFVAGYSWPREALDQKRNGSTTLGFGVELLFGREP